MPTKRMKVEMDGGIIKRLSGVQKKGKRRRENRTAGRALEEREKALLVGRAGAEKSDYFEPIKRLRKTNLDWEWKSRKN